LVTCTKGLDIRGAGIGNTIIVDKTSGVFNKEPITLTTANGYTTKISNMTFDGTDSVADSSGMLVMTGTNGQGNFRIHHIKFQNIKIRGLVVKYVFGLVDHCTFISPWDLTGRALDIMGDGATAWTRPLTLGTENCVCVEDCLIDNPLYDNEGLDGYNGARIVFRHNIINNSRIGFHGCDSGSYRSTHSFEIYDNKFTTICDEGGQGFRTRGGTGVLYNNTFTGVLYGTYLYLVNYRSCAPYGTWGQCDGANAIDGNDDASGYHCQDQVGWTSTGADDGTGPNQILSPVYAWDNTHDGTEYKLGIWTSGMCASQLDHIKENRDFYNGVAKPGYVASPYPHSMNINRSKSNVIPILLANGILGGR
jgi:hypothetical protein